MTLEIIIYNKRILDFLKARSFYINWDITFTFRALELNKFLHWLSALLNYPYDISELSIEVLYDTVPKGVSKI